MFTEMDCVPVTVDKRMQGKAERYVQRKLRFVRDTVERRALSARREDLKVGHLAKEAVIKYLTVNMNQQRGAFEEYDRIRTDQFQCGAPWELQFGELSIDVRSSIERTIQSNILHRIVLERHHILPASPTIIVRGNQLNFRDHLRDGWTLLSIPNITPSERNAYISTHPFLKNCIIRVYFIKKYGLDICFLIGWIEGRKLVNEGTIGILPRYSGLYHILPIRQGNSMLELQRYLRNHR
jgi:hypothetical protein